MKIKELRQAAGLSQAELAERVKVNQTAVSQWEREGANHDIYYNAKLGTMIPIKRHDFDESDLRYIVKEIKQKQRDRG